MSLAARQGPAAIWIELTSKCPLRCVFCSRENLRGEGEHMNMAMLESILSSLDRPEIVRLNYSGESGNYPWLIEAMAESLAANGYVWNSFLGNFVASDAFRSAPALPITTESP